MDLVMGTTAVVVPVPAADPLVDRARLAYDAAAALGVPAHVTVLYPFLELAEIDPATLAELAALVASEPTFPLLLQRFGRFSGVLWLMPEPDEPFRRLTAAVTARWPQAPPYGGQWPDPTPHLTVVDLDDAQVFSAVEASVGARLPVRTRVHEAQLLAYDGERFTCHAHLPLGGAPLG